MIRTARIKNYQETLERVGGVEGVQQAIARNQEEYKGYIGSMGFASVNAKAGVCLKNISYYENVLEWVALVEELGEAGAREQALENDRNAPKPYIPRW